MKFTNRLGLPGPLVAAIMNDPYTGHLQSDYTTTQLIKPPRMLALQRANQDKIVEDVATRIWALLGQIVHYIIERAATDELVEKRLFARILDKSVSGQIDLYRKTILWDWKLTSIYATKEGVKDEWTAQGNINRLLCVENNIEVTGIQYVALYRDWSKSKAEREKDYPRDQLQIFDLPLWPIEKALAFTEGRIRLHEASKHLLPQCTSQERWATAPVWALMKKGRKKAVKLFYDAQHADVGLANTGTDKPKHCIQYRPGESRRCKDYCSAAPFCTQYQAEVGQSTGFEVLT